MDWSDSIPRFQLIWIESGADVTVAGAGTGSLSVLDVERSRVYLATTFSPQMLLTHLANQINRFLLEPLKYGPDPEVLECSLQELIGLTRARLVCDIIQEHAAALRHP